MIQRDMWTSCSLSALSDDLSRVASLALCNTAPSPKFQVLTVSFQVHICEFSKSKFEQLGKASFDVRVRYSGAHLAGSRGGHTRRAAWGGQRVHMHGIHSRRVESTCDRVMVTIDRVTMQISSEEF
jgi:hypothetical protein